MTIRFGMTLNSIDGAAENARRLESLGYDYAACGEHVSFHRETSNSFISLAAAAGATSTIRLVSTIVLLPLYPAALAAKLAATLDVVSGGRYELGIGIGGEMPREFEACGVPVAERGARVNEALPLIRRLLAGETVDHAGRFNTLNGVRLQPPARQQPLPIWVSGRKEPAMRRAARHADGWMPYMYTPEMLADSIASIRRFCAEAGRPADAVTPSIYAFTACHEDSATALAMATDKLGAQYAQDFSKIAAKYTVTGTPAECRARLREYIDAGARTVFLSSACPPEYADRNEELIAKEVLPALR